MKGMSEFVSKLEGYSDLEVSIIRLTKINKVLKAIIKLPSIPKEEEYKFKSRSQTLLDKWNKLLANDQGTPVANTNGTSENKGSEDEKPAAPKAATNRDNKTGSSKTGSSKTEAKDEVDAKIEPAAAASAPETKEVQPVADTEEPKTAEKDAEVCT